MALAAVLNPLKQELKNKKVGVIVCGSNIDLNTYLDHVDHLCCFSILFDDK